MIDKFFIVQRALPIVKSNQNLGLYTHLNAHRSNMESIGEDFNFFEGLEIEGENNKTRNLFKNIITILISGIVFILLLGWYDLIRKTYDEIWNSSKNYKNVIVKLNYIIFITFLSIFFIFILYHINDLI